MSGNPADGSVTIPYVRGGKKIRWNNNQWECEPITVGLFYKSKKSKEKTPVDIDYKKIKMSDSRGWLEFGGGEPTMTLDKRWIIPVRIQEGKEEQLVPTGFTDTGPGKMRLQIGSIPKKVVPIPASKQIYTELTVTLDVVSGSNAMDAALSAAGGAVPGFGKAISGTTPKTTVKSRPIKYFIEPPVPVWKWMLWLLRKRGYMRILPRFSSGNLNGR